MRIGRCFSLGPLPPQLRTFGNATGYGAGSGRRGTRADLPASACVAHVYKDGWHTFTCLEIPEFHLVSTEADLEAAYAEVPEAIAEIIESDTGVPPAG
jgi:hypothetical protein